MLHLVQSVPARVVLGVLIIFSVASWCIILYKLFSFNRIHSQSVRFLEIFRRSTKFSEVQAVCRSLGESPLVVLYDGRARAEDNWHEVTGVARSTDGRTLVAEDLPVIRSPHSDGALRYVAAVPLPGGGTRFYFEAARPDGAHDLMSCVTG